LSFFVTTYRQIADWRAVVQRLEGFEAAVATGRKVAVTDPIVHVVRKESPALSIDDLDLRLPNGQLLMRGTDVAIAPHDQILIVGPSGEGKSTLLRAISGIWPFGDGTVTIPKDAKVMVLPQRPYLPIGTLHAAIAYPAGAEEFDQNQMRETIIAVGLPALAERLTEEAHWNRMLSLGEQQRLGIARALLHAPDYLFLDEATASLDEPAEAALYTLIKSRLPKSAVISVGHRSTLAAFHSRRLEVAKTDKTEGSTILREIPASAALR
jgi:putative ATP-binding cassette transporter